MTAAEQLQRTVLHDRHVALGAKMVPFAGWEMPVSYEGTVAEHLAVRNHVGMFDVSHMGRIEVTGKDAERFCDFLSTNKIIGKQEFSATYTVWCHEDGGSVDDVIVYKENAEKFFVIVNAANRQKDLVHMEKAASEFEVAITPKYDEEGILAVQGKCALPLMHELFPESTSLKFMKFMVDSFQGDKVIVSRTGYTGEPGFELYASNRVLPQLWDRVMELGEKVQIAPVGLGARDTLRLEAGFALYGHELSDEIKPTESISSWTVKMEKGEFLGKGALEKFKAKRTQIPLRLIEKGVPREGYEVFQGERRVGVVTSGTQSPSLGIGIAIAMVDLTYDQGHPFSIQIRNRKVAAEMTTFPFIKGA